MNTALWVAAIVLAIASAGSGAMKLAKTKEQLLADPRMGWAESFSQNAIRGIGTLELLGALGLILPAVTGIAPVLVGLAAVGIALVMLGAAVTHLRRGETAAIVPPLVLMAVAIFVAWGRLGPYAFGS